MPNQEKNTKKNDESTEKREIPTVTAEEIRRKEIAPHQGSTIGPSPAGNVGDSQIP